jgi:CubicO group peptidase (beta-lactamase class C family)
MGQNTAAFADSIRRLYKIPEIAYAVVSSDSVLELATIGVKKINTFIYVESNDKFRIGSNTKAITSFIAAQLVKQKKINWSTKFFDLFPELTQESNKEYRNMTLLDLLSFRTKLFPYTYTFSKPLLKISLRVMKRSNVISLQSGF